MEGEKKEKTGFHFSPLIFRHVFVRPFGRRPVMVGRQRLSTNRRSMEQTDNLARVRINARQIRAFAQIALVTGPRQVLGFVETPMLSRGDVLDVKGMIAV